MYFKRFIFSDLCQRKLTIHCLFGVTCIVLLLTNGCATLSSGVPWENLQGHFEVVALTEIVRANVTISDQSWGLLRDMIVQGLDKLERENATPEDYKRAETNLKRFVFLEIIEARRQDPQFPRIGEGIFDYVYNLICPLYPFC